MLFEGISTPPPMIVGGFSLDNAREHSYNSALLLDSRGQVVSRYLKMHLVMFGEYVPLVHVFPFLSRLTPIEEGLNRGTSPAGMRVGGVVYAPTICFESSVSHLVVETANWLAARGEEPDVLINVTDDGWFYGSALLDHHLACGVLRAVEARKPFVIAANTGFSALIDAAGNIRVKGPRRQPAVLEMDIPLPSVNSPFRTVRDWPVMFLAAVCVVALLTRGRRSPAVQASERPR
jgi:apolipoprotein N-acyltransferase